MGPSMTRRRVLVATAATAGVFAIRRSFAARRTVIRLGHDIPVDHPVNVHAIEAGKKIRDATQGEVDLQVFPNNQLGDDTHMLANLRSGAMQMMALGDNILATLVPSTAIDNLGFVFKSPQDAWTALDGGVGDIVRADIAKAGLVPMHRIWDEGFRQITTSTKPINSPDDLKGLKMRVPPSPISLSLFQCLGAAPVTLNSAELYTALQTHVVDGQENPLGNIETMKLPQVQKYVAISDHMWVGYWLLMNATFWQSLPADHRKIVADTFDAEAVAEREANQKLDATLVDRLKQEGMTVTTPDHQPFRDVLVKAGFYKTWQDKFGPALWTALEKYTGPLS